MQTTNPSHNSFDTTPKGPAGTSLYDRIKALRNALMTGLVERDLAIRLALLAALAGEHLLLIGPPGTAKSLVARRLRQAFRGATYFERLLTRFTVPEELFGPLSVKGLEEDRYERLTAGYLPTASVAFLDEIFKANSAILNALLTLLNERQFDNGDRRVDTPLIAVVGASNELPDSEELDALYDRFLLRLRVGPVSEQGFAELLTLQGEPSPRVDHQIRITPEELRQIRAEAEAIPLQPDLISLLCELRNWCAREGIVVSDRRWRKMARLLKVSAFTNGRTEASIWDAWLVQHCIWNRPEQREAVFSWYAERVGSSAKMDAPNLARLVQAWEGLLARDRAASTQARDENGQPLYKRLDGTLTTEPTGPVPVLDEDGEPRYLAHPEMDVRDRTNNGRGFSADEIFQASIGDRYRWGRREVFFDAKAYLDSPESRLTRPGELPPAMEPMQFPTSYVQARIQEVNEHIQQVQEYLSSLGGHMKDLTTTLDSHLWITGQFSKLALNTLRDTRQRVQGLSTRLEAVRDGFAKLPVHDAPLPPTPLTEGDGGDRT